MNHLSTLAVEQAQETAQHPTLLAQKPRPSKAVKLAAAAQAAADVRAYDTNPDVIAYRIERLRAYVDRLVWTGVILGLAFTAANVQAFAAGDAPMYSTGWWIAWLLDPMVSLILIGALIGEQILSRHQLRAGGWVRALKWVTLAATYAMNTWESWDAGDPALILLHSVPPLVVFVAAEAITDLRHWITEAVRKAYAEAVSTDPAPVHAELAPAPVRRAYVFRTAPRTEAPRTVQLRRTFTFQAGPAAAPVRTIRRAFAFTATPRTVRFTRAFSFQPAARTEPAPARTETPLPALADRTEFVRTIRTEILAAAERNDRWGPDYNALMARTGRSKSWVEKRVREARMSMFRTEAAA